MRDLSECKAEIRRQIESKERRRSSLHKRLAASFSVCSVVIVCFIAIMIVPNVITNRKTVYISSNNIKKYDSLEEIVNDSNLILIGTVQNERTILTDQTAPETVKTEYDIVIERLIIGDYDDNTITVTTSGGMVNNVNYALKDSEKYVVGEKYIVFLYKPISEAAAAVFSNQYVETSQLMGKIHINEDRIDTNTNKWNIIDDFSSLKNVDELIRMIQRIKEMT